MTGGGAGSGGDEVGWALSGAGAGSPARAIKPKPANQIRESVAAMAFSNRGGTGQRVMVETFRIGIILVFANV
jgi:hypothetical protein